MTGRGRDAARVRIVAVWVVLAVAAATVVLLRATNLGALREAAQSQADAVAARAASSTAHVLDQNLDEAVTLANRRLRGPVTPDLVREARELAGSELAMVFDTTTGQNLGSSAIGTTSEFDLGSVTLDFARLWIDDIDRALEAGAPRFSSLAPLDGLDDSLVIFLVPYTAEDGSGRLLTLASRLQESVIPNLLEASSPGFLTHVEDGNGQRLFHQQGPSSRHDDEVPDVVARQQVQGTNWVVVAHAMHADLSNGLGSPFSGLPFTIALVVLSVLALGALATRSIRASGEVETAYEQVAWAAHQQSEFTALIAHELRTPATASSGLAAFLDDQWDGLDDQQRRDLAQRVASSTQDLARLVSDLRLSQGLSSGPVSLAPTARRVGDLIASAIDQAKVDAELVEVHGDVEHNAIVDERFASRAIAGVLVNAAAHGAPPIDINVSAGLADLSIRIRDHGEGVPADFVGVLFEPFTQARSHLRREHRGTGLGLHLVKAIVEQMGGRVDYAAADPGSIFTIRLPLGRKGSATPEVVEEIDEAPTFNAT